VLDGAVSKVKKLIFFKYMSFLGLYHKSKNQIFIDKFSLAVIPANAGISSGRGWRFLNSASLRQEWHLLNRWKELLIQPPILYMD